MDVWHAGKTTSLLPFFFPLALDENSTNWQKCSEMFRNYVMLITLREFKIF